MLFSGGYTTTTPYDLFLLGSATKGHVIFVPPLTKDLDKNLRASVGLSIGKIPRQG